ncbi:MAG: hypothetical protein HY012_00855 [Acidobacteria bacterium]|nr:hypothetical protein [Acidobacteriota bacterium]
MKAKGIFLVAVCSAILWTMCMAGVPAAAQEQAAPDAKKRAAEILAEAAAATGGEALKKVESLSFTSAGDVKRPGFLRHKEHSICPRI